MSFQEWDKANPINLNSDRPTSVMHVAMAGQLIQERGRLAWLACEEEHARKVERLNEKIESVARTSSGQGSVLVEANQEPGGGVGASEDARVEGRVPMVRGEVPVDVDGITLEDIEEGEEQIRLGFAFDVTEGVPSQAQIKLLLKSWENYATLRARLAAVEEKAREVVDERKRCHTVSLGLLQPQLDRLARSIDALAALVKP